MIDRIGGDELVQRGQILLINDLIIKSLNKSLVIICCHRVSSLLCIHVLRRWKFFRRSVYHRSTCKMGRSLVETVKVSGEDHFAFEMEVDATSRCFLASPI